MKKKLVKVLALLALSIGALALSSCYSSGYCPTDYDYGYSGGGSYSCPAY